MAKLCFHTFSVHYVIPYLRSRAEKEWWCKLQDKNARSKITAAGILAKGTLCIQKRGSTEPLNPSTACEHKGVAQEENLGYTWVIIIHLQLGSMCPLTTYFHAFQLKVHPKNRGQFANSLWLIIFLLYRGVYIRLFAQTDKFLLEHTTNIADLTEHYLSVFY